MKKTALYEEHLSLNGRMVDFGGWQLPVQYTGIIEEHLAVRRKAGIFDVSHMGEFWILGKDAEAFIQYLVTNDISHLKDNQIAYSPMCYEDGNTVDDLLIHRYDKEKYLLVVNASNCEKDWQWINEHKRGDVQLENASDETAEIALQGPEAQNILAQLTDINLDNLAFYHFYPSVNLAGFEVLLSRSGYTGEDGFEIYVKNEYAEALYQKIMEKGKTFGLLPCGLGARDTLRFEAALPLYGHELSADINPLEAGLGSFVKVDKPDYIGKNALSSLRAQGVKRKLVGLELIDKGVARENYPVYQGEKEIGFVTSGSYAPSLGKNYALALIEASEAEPSNEVMIAVRQRLLKARVVKRPFVKKNYKK